jgi:hypothetical protein
MLGSIHSSDILAKMSVAKMSVAKMSVAKMSVAKMNIAKEGRIIYDIQGSHR